MASAAALLAAGLIAGTAGSFALTKSQEEDAPKFPEDRGDAELAAQRARTAAANRKGRSSNILTLGGGGEGSTARATLLGGNA